jgi:REP element-mobilizing transposase RayT
LSRTPPPRQFAISEIGLGPDAQDRYGISMARPPRIPVWLNWDREVVYFVTLCVEKRQRVLANEAVMLAMRNAIGRLNGWKVMAGVLMPDHLHLLTSPQERDAPLGNLVGALKRWIRQDVKASWQWQRGSFDRLLRSGESAAEKWLYVRENPVRAGLVKDWQDWPYLIGFDSLRNT